MFPGFQRRHADGHMQVVMQADVYGLDVFPTEQVSEVDVDILNSISSGYITGMLPVRVGDGDYGNFRDGPVVFQVDLSDLTDTNNAYAQFFLHPSLHVC